MLPNTTLENNKYRFFRVFLVVFTTIFFIFINSTLVDNKAKAATLYLNPATGSILTTTFELTTSIDSKNNNNIKSIDVYIVFDSSLVNVERIDKIGLTSTSTATYNNSTGTAHIKGDFTQTPAVSTVVNFAKIYFKSLSGSKGSTAKFEVDQTLNESAIFSTSGENVLTSAVGSNLLIDTNSSIVTASTGTSVPSTGSNSLYMTVIFLILSAVLILFAQKNVTTKL